MAVARLVAAPFPLAASRGRSAPSAAATRLVFAPLSVRAASDGRAGAAASGGQEPDEAAARRAVEERAARKQSERRTYLVAAVMSSLGITSMAAAAVYYRFAWQMEVIRNHPRALEIYQNKLLESGKISKEGIDWAVGEALAFATLIIEGNHQCEGAA